MSGWQLITAADDFLHRHTRAVAIVSVACLVLSAMHHAGFIRLPELWQLPAAVAWLVPAVRWGVWESLVTPKLQARRASIARIEGQRND